MSSIEQLYQDAVDTMTPAQRVARCVEMFNWSREFLGRQILSERPETSNERLKILVALRMYGSDPRMKTLLKGLLENVPD